MASPAQTCAASVVLLLRFTVCSNVCCDCVGVHAVPFDAQSLADHAALHAQVSAAYNLTSANKWVSFGGSYSGALSAWMRLKYPALISGVCTAWRVCMYVCM